MKIIEEYRDLFTVSPEYVLVHCISYDLKMGAGIAKEFTKRGVRKTLIGMNFPTWENKGFSMWAKMGDYDVINLITKDMYYHKPTYKSLKESLEGLKYWALYWNRKKFAMPRIGCGLDKLEWDKVKKIIQEEFEDTDVEILVCNWK